jgi:hypothetical protein
MRDAVTRLETFTQMILSGKDDAQVPLSATQVPPSYLEQSVSVGKVVPRDRIELSTPAFSGHKHTEDNQLLKSKRRCKN